MVSNAEIKMIRSLHEKKFRQENGMFIVEGEKMVEEAVASGFEIVRIVKEEEIGEEKMKRLSLLNTPSPVLAVVRIPRSEIGAELPDGLCLALDSVRDPGNLGTIIRLSDWFGISCIYASHDTVELYNPKVIQATMGAVFRKKVVYCDLPDLCRRFADSGRRIYGTFLDGKNIYSSELKPDGLVVMGNESNGISAEVASLVSDRITIPCFAPEGKRPESLNVAIATAVTVSEFCRSISASSSQDKI